MLLLCIPFQSIQPANTDGDSPREGSSQVFLSSQTLFQRWMYTYEQLWKMLALEVEFFTDMEVRRKTKKEFYCSPLNGDVLL